ncbi:DHHW family protein [Clostridium senegalense]|uniref:DHHW family protein n=1 Tax=Clostridium senegalense TaxID=1465809 RepID=UPI0002F7638A|nr:DHHW family protein [Clostridium senegalense]
MKFDCEKENERKNKIIKKMQLINIFVFALIILTLSLCSIIMPKKTISEDEKRALTKYPKFSLEEIMKGKYFSQIESFYNDTFPFRDKLLSIDSYVDSLKGLREGDEEIKLYK